MTEEQQVDTVKRVRELYSRKKADFTISANDLASAIERDGKTLRAYLRRAHTRASEERNSNWQIEKDVALDCAEHFSTAKRAPREQQAS